MLLPKKTCPKCKDVFYNEGDRESIAKHKQCTMCVRGIKVGAMPDYDVQMSASYYQTKRWDRSKKN